MHGICTLPIPLRKESPSGVWVPLPSQGTRLKPLMQAMPFARLAQEGSFLTTTLTMACSSSELVRPGITKAQAQRCGKRNTSHRTTNAPRLNTEQLLNEWERVTPVLTNHVEREAMTAKVKAHLPAVVVADVQPSTARLCGLTPEGQARPCLGNAGKIHASASHAASRRTRRAGKAYERCQHLLIFSKSIPMTNS